MILEYLKLGIALLGVLSVVFAGLQWRIANQIAIQTVYQRMTTEWRDHLRTFVEKPEFRPVFRGEKGTGSG